MTPELRTACEVVFQEHKSSDRPITWHKDAFRGRVSLGLSELAKETLVRRNIIYFPNQAKRTITQLNPVVASAETFEEAIEMVQCKVPSLVSNVRETADVNFVSDFIHHPTPSSSRLIRITAKPAQVISREKWYLKPLFYYIVWPVCAAGLGLLIAYLMSEFISSQWE